MLRNNLFNKGVVLMLIGLFVTPSVRAEITASAVNYKAQALVITNFGNDNSGLLESVSPPLLADALVSESQGTATAMGYADFLNLQTVSAVSVIPHETEIRYGMAVAASLEVIFELTSTTAWQMEINTSPFIDYSSNGICNMDAIAIVLDSLGGEVYKYQMSTDGFGANEIFAPGTYHLALRATSLCFAYTLPGGVAEYAESDLNLEGILTPIQNTIPAPAAGLLTAIGVGMIGWLRRRTL